MFNLQYFFSFTKITILYSFYYILLPLFKVDIPVTLDLYRNNLNAVYIAISLLLAFFTYIYLLYKVVKDRKIISIGLFGFLVFLVFLLIQVWYRASPDYTGFKFIFTWNRYAFLPQIGILLTFVPLLHLISIKLNLLNYLIILLILLSFVIFHNKTLKDINNYHYSLFVNPRVIEITKNFDLILSKAKVGEAIPEIEIDENIFLPSYPLKLSTYKHFHKTFKNKNIKIISKKDFKTKKAFQNLKF